jgi:hypothetical protein
MVWEQERGVATGAAAARILAPGPAAPDDEFVIRVSGGDRFGLPQFVPWSVTNRPRRKAKQDQRRPPRVATAHRTFSSTLH